MRIVRWVAVVAAAGLLVSGCGGSSDDATESGDTAGNTAGASDAGVDSGGDSTEAGSEGGSAGGETSDAILHMALTQDMESLLPMDSGQADNIAVLDVVYDGLVRYDPETTEPHNYVAESIETDDNTVWTIKIKPDLKFQNDEPVDAASFARAWNYAAYGPNAMWNNYFFERFEGYQDLQSEDEDSEPKAKELSGLEVVDDTTLKVTLNGPFSGFGTMLGYTGFFPVAQACIDDVDACAKKPIGNGPFKVDEWEQGVKLTASRWDDYVGDEKPSYAGIEWTEYSGANDWADFQAGTIDASGDVPAAEWESVNNDPAYTDRKVEKPGAALTYIGFPMYKGAPFDKPEFRKAISQAIDRQAIIDAVVPGQYIPADSWVVPDGVPGGVAGTCDFCTFDVEAAKKALEEAGGWPEGEKLTIHLGEDETQQAVFKAVGDAIQLNLGIPYELDPTPDFSKRRADRDFSGIWRANWFPDYPLNENYLTPVYGANDPKKGNESMAYYSEDFNKLIKEGDEAADLDAAVAKYQEAEKVLNTDAASVPLMFSQNVTFYSERLDNVVLDPFSGSIKLRPLTVKD